MLLLGTVMCSQLVFQGCSNNTNDNNTNEHIENDEIDLDYENEILTSDTDYNEESVLQGNPIEFYDSNIRKCICDMLSKSADDIVTDVECENITQLDCSEYKLSTLEDMEKFPNLKVLYIDNSEQPLNLKGINKAKNLVALTLRNCNLMEVDRIAELSNLRYLDLSTDSSWGTQVVDYSSLANLKNLEVLNMEERGYNAYNYYKARDIDGAFIASLTNLKELYLRQTELNAYPLSNLSKLERLSVSEYDKDELLKQLFESGAISNIKYLDIGMGEGKSVTNEGISYLSKASSLEKLIIPTNSDDFTSLRGFSSLKNLKYLEFTYTLSHIPNSEYEEISELKNLETLSFDSTDCVDEEGRKYYFLNGLNNLTELTIAPFNDMELNDLPELDTLEKLNLLDIGTSTTMVDASGIDKFKNLKELNYSDHVRFKSTAPFDDLEYINLHEIGLMNHQSITNNKIEERNIYHKEKALDYYNK